MLESSGKSGYINDTDLHYASHSGVNALHRIENIKLDHQLN